MKSKEEKKKYQHEWYLRNKERLAERGSQYYQNNRERLDKKNRAWIENNPERYKEYHTKWWEKNKEKCRAATRKAQVKLRKIILSHYGNGEVQCVRCGFDNIHALSIDHINGGGTNERREMKTSINLYNRLKRDGFPTGYQTLCMNCQFIKRHENKECYQGQLKKAMEKIND